MSLCLHCNHEQVHHQGGPCRAGGVRCESGCSEWEARVEETQLRLTLHVDRLEDRAWITDPRGQEHPIVMHRGRVRLHSVAVLGGALADIALDVIDSGPVAVYTNQKGTK